MSSVSLKLLAGLKIPACIAIGCGGTVVVQHYTTSSSLSWDEKAAKEKDGSGKGMKFEINQLSKQLEEKEQSLKTWEGMLAKQAADLKEQQAAVSSVSAQTKTVTTVAKPKLEQPIIDEAPFGEEGAKPGKLKASNIAQWGITKREAEVPTNSAPKRPAVFDGGGTPAVAFGSTGDVVAIKEEGDISEALQEKNRRLAELNASNEDLKRELEETKQKLAKAEAEAKQQVCRLKEECESLVLNAECGVRKEMQKKMARMKEQMQWMDLLKFPDGRDMCFLVSTIEVPNIEDRSALNCAMKSEEVLRSFKKGCRNETSISANVLQKRAKIKPVALCYRFREFPESVMVCTVVNKEHGSILSCCCRRKPKHCSTSEQRKLLNDVSAFANKISEQCKLLNDAGAFANKTSEQRKLLNDADAFADKNHFREIRASLENGSESLWKKDTKIVAPTDEVSGNSNETSTEDPSKGWFYCLFCPCKKRTNEIRKLEYKEAVTKVKLEEPEDSVKTPELFNELSPEERGIKEEIGTNRTPLEGESTPKKSGIFGFFGSIGNCFNCVIGVMSAVYDGTMEMLQVDDEDFRKAW